MSNPQYLSTSQAARLLGVEQHTVQRWANDGLFPGMHKTPGGRRRIPVEDVEKLLKTQTSAGKCLIYLRVSSEEESHLLDQGLAHLTDYALRRGYVIAGIVKEIGPGLDGERPHLKSIRTAIQNGDAIYETIIVEQPDRLLLLGGEEFIRWAAPMINVEVAGVSCPEADLVYRREWLMELYYPLCDALALRGIPPARIERAISAGLEGIAEALGLFHARPAAG